MACWFCVLACTGLAQPASAAPAAASCVAYSPENRALVSDTIDTLAWNCEAQTWHDGQPVTWLRFDVAGDQRPSFFSSRITMFRDIAIASLAKDGTLATRTYRPEDATPVMAGAVFSLPLPKTDANTLAIFVRIARAHSVTIASEARVSADPDHAHDGVTTALIIAIVAGMLLTPLLFDINFFLVLRERFVLMHAAMVVSMIGYVLLAGGLITLFAIVPVSVIAIGGPLFWAVGVAFAAFFLSSFLEPDILRPRLTRLARGLGWWTLLVPTFFALQLPATQRIDNTAYFLALAPVLLAYTVIIGIALRRGSRAARFLAAAWLPVMLASGERLLRGLGIYSGSTSFDHGLFIALGIEVVVIAMGVADRFLAVRRERDSARDEARSMIELTERDPLTGLLNRRALELRFDHLRREGFQTLALVDLDRFKDVNDRFGHLIGDDVLRSVAAALALDRNALAFRLGGEEFVLLLRGSDALSRAERLRQGISARVAADVPGLDRIVTASAGLIDLSSKILPASGLTGLYERADKLLYEAKEGGRNRMVSEKLQMFRPRTTDRRREKAA